MSALKRENLVLYAVKLSATVPTTSWKNAGLNDPVVWPKKLREINSCSSPQQFFRQKPSEASLRKA